ncbi:MAG TPA: type II secretion system protein [bacterium]|nr:type II secretion system protein [bacterium]
MNTKLHGQNRCSDRTGFVLLEVLVSMTILAVAGTALIQCFQACIDAQKRIKQRSQAIYLTQSRILDMEFLYYGMESVRRAQHHGDYRDLGFPNMWWEASVKVDRKRYAHEITVTTSWEQTNKTYSYSMTTLVPLPRYDDRLVR